MAAPTTLSISVDQDEYSRFESENSIITASISATGAGTSGEQVIIQLLKARRGRDQIVCYKTITLDGTLNPQILEFDLTELIDDHAIPMVRRGKYFLKAISVTNSTIFGITEDFLISLITVDYFQKEYLHGINLPATNVLSPHDQPSLVTGITIYNVSRDHAVGWHTLAYNLSETVRTLSWCGGPLVSIIPGKTKYLLRRGSSADYIEVRVAPIPSLPIESVAEEILIEKTPFSVSNIRSLLDDNISWLEDAELQVYLEPTVIITEFLSNYSQPGVGTNVPVFSSDADFDKKVNALSYFIPAAGHWINFRFPYYPIQKFYRLYGKVANVSVMEIDLNWTEFHEKGGFVELVPYNQTNAFNFQGLLLVGSLRGPIPLPNFWNFKALVGFKETPLVLIELIAKKTAIDVLTLIAQAIRPGLGSTSVSRDGISESISYLATQQFGIFTGVINAYQAWIDENLGKFKGAFRGPNLLVL